MQEKHPVLRPRGFIAKTGPLEEFVQEFSRHASQSGLAMATHGQTRVGKTSAIEYLQARLAASGAMVPMWTHVANFDEQNRSVKFWRSWRTDNEEATQFSFVDAYRALLGTIQTRCERAATSNVLFILDEAQALDLQRLDMLKLLTEDLIRLRYSPFVLLMGQPPLLSFRSRLLKAHREDLVARFFGNLYEFRGMKEQDLHGLLAHYDTARWPEMNSPTYTETFLPALWQKGWRMAAQGPALWQSFNRLALRLRLSTPHQALEVGPAYIVRAVQVLLTEAGDRTNAPTAGDFDQAVDQSGFAETASFNLREAEETDRSLVARARRRA